MVNEYGSEHSVTKEVVVEEKLKSSFDFGIFSGSVPLKVDFSNYSTQNAVRYIWNFGDGTSSTEANPNHSYALAGQYTIELTITDNDGDTNTVSTTGYATELYIGQTNSQCCLSLSYVYFEFFSQTIFSTRYHRSTICIANIQNSTNFFIIESFN